LDPQAGSVLRHAVAAATGHQCRLGGGQTRPSLSFTKTAGSLLLTPLLTLVLAGLEWVLTLLVGLMSVSLAVYLGWQGIEGLRLG